MPTVLPQQNTTLSASCLAIPSMGSMVLRMDGRKGTIPNAVRERLSQGLQAQPSSHPPPPSGLGRGPQKYSSQLQT